MGDLTKRLFTDPERRSLAAIARERRFRLFLERFPDLPEMRVLDLGGEAHTWLAAPVHPKHATLLNLEGKVPRTETRLSSEGADEWMEIVGGDACEPPAEITGQRFDLVYSNSVIEHLGGHLRRRHFSYWARTLGEHHWVQTPNRYFPLEPHWVAPGFHYLPPRAQGAVLRYWPVGNHGEKPWFDRVQAAMGIELLTPGALRSYFPMSELIRERVLGLAKSLIVVGSG